MTASHPIPDTRSPIPPPRYDSRRLGFAAGVAAAAVMLVAIVLLRLASGVESLPEVVADGLLLSMPGAVFSAVLDTLQHAAKPLFYLAVGIGMLIVGGLLGRWYGADPGWAQAIRVVLGVWFVFGLVVYTVLHAGPFGQYLQAGFVWHALSLLLVFAVFGAALHGVHDVLVSRATSPAAGVQVERRGLLRGAGASVLAVVLGGAAWRLITASAPDAPDAEERARALASSSNAPPFDVAGISPEVTPTDSFYTVSKNFLDPNVSAAGWRLRIDGLVDQPLELTYEQLTSLPATEGFYTLMCISNEIGGPQWGNAKWRGVLLRDLLTQAGVHTDAYKAVFTAADDYKDSVHLAAALHPQALLAWEMNGERLHKEHGFPARLLIPGIYGMKNVKWLTRITIVADDVRGFWQNQGWDDDAPYQTESRIDTPRPRDTIGPGTLAVGGVAFAGDRGIRTVEVSLDSGQTWLPAQVKPGLSDNTWQLWRADVPVDHNVHDIRVRATDGLGHTQLREANPPFPSGATGYHRITIAVT